MTRKKPPPRISTVHRIRIERRTPIDGEMGGTQFHTETHEIRTDPGNQSQQKSRFRMPNIGIGTFTGNALVAEFLLAVSIISLRAIADYVPKGSGAEAGDEQPSKGAHPLTMLSATLAVYFVLALAARGNSWISRAAVMFGLLMDITLLINSSSEIETVSGWFSSTRGSGSSGSGSSGDSSPASNPNNVIQNPGNPLF